MTAVKVKPPKLEPIIDRANDLVQKKNVVYSVEIIQKLNDPYEGKPTDDDPLLCVHRVEGEFLESETLRQQEAITMRE